MQIANAILDGDGETGVTLYALFEWLGVGGGLKVWMYLPYFKIEIVMSR